MKYEKLRVAELPATRKLLRAASLPHEDIDAHFGEFIGCFDGDSLVGAVGLERYGSVALLRSLVVDGNRRGGGIGKALVAEIERAAKERGVRELCLLTMTAKSFFWRLGYETVARDSLSPEIRETREFLELCPVSSTCMRKSL